MGQGVLVSALLLGAMSAKAETWVCVSLNHQYKLNVQSSVEAGNVGVLGPIAGFGQIQLRGKQISLAGSFQGYDSYDIAVTLSRAPHNPQRGTAEAQVKTQIDGGTSSHLDIRFACSIN